MNNHFDQIIIGGGVIGCSIAYQLSKRGYKVMILESGKSGYEASGAAAGMLGGQGEFTEDGPLFQFAQRSRLLFETLSEELLAETGVDIQYVHKGILKLAFDQQQYQQLEKIASFQKAAGNPAFMMSPREVLKKEKGVTDEVEGGLYLPNDGQVSAGGLSRAFSSAAQKHGAVLHEREKVLSLLMESGKIHGVKTIHADYYADQVVTATGAFSSGLLPGEYSALPVKGECLELGLDRPLFESTIWMDGCYLVPKEGGKVVIGASSMPGHSDKCVSASAVNKLLRQAEHMVPQLAGANVTDAWAGIRPSTIDGRPFLGEVPDVEGLYIAKGHYRNGILLSPITGIYMADLMEKRVVDPLFYDGFGLERHMGSTVSGGESG